MADRRLAGQVAVVAGATRGTGRGIALALGEAGATVYCTGRSVRGRVPVPPVVPPGTSEGRARHIRAFALSGRPETIDETAELVAARGGVGIAVQVDHTDQAQVRALFQRVEREQDGRLDILVNDIWGGDELSAWGTPFWEMDLDRGFRMMDRAIRAHIITSRYGAPLLVRRRRGLIVEVTDGDGYNYRGELFYSLCKVSAIHLAEAMASDLDDRLGRDHAVTTVALTPGMLRSEAMLDFFGVTEERWREAAPRDGANLEDSESPLFAGRAVVALATDPDVHRRAGRALRTCDLSDDYHFLDIDGTRMGRRRRYVEGDALLRGVGPAPLEEWFNNVGTSPDRMPWAADIDGQGWSLSAEALAEAGVSLGGAVVVDGIAFRWPLVRPCTADNVVCAGQVVQLPAQPGATRVGFLGLSTQGASTGQGEIRYADGSTQPFTLSLPDFVTGEGDGLPPGVRVALRTRRWNDRKGWSREARPMVFACSVPLRSEGTAVTLTLPQRADGQGEQHIFAVALDGAEQ